MVRIVVPFSAGSITDGLARVLADKLAERWQQQVIVENRPGIAGTASVAKAAPDGYTLMLTSNGHTIASVVNKNLLVRSGEGLRRRHRGRRGAAGADRAARSGREERQGVHRAGAQEPRQDEFHLGGACQHVLSRRRAVQADCQDRHRARAEQGRAGGGHQRDAQRRAAVLSRRQSRGRSAPDRQGAGHRGVDAQAQPARCPTCRRSPSPACRTTSTTPGSP